MTKIPGKLEPHRAALTAIARQYPQELAARPELTQFAVRHKLATWRVLAAYRVLREELEKDG